MASAFLLTKNERHRKREGEHFLAISPFSPKYWQREAGLRPFTRLTSRRLVVPFLMRCACALDEWRLWYEIIGLIYFLAYCFDLLPVFGLVWRLDLQPYLGRNECQYFGAPFKLSVKSVYNFYAAPSVVQIWIDQSPPFIFSVTISPVIWRNKM